MKTTRRHAIKTFLSTVAITCSGAAMFSRGFAQSPPTSAPEAPAPAGPFKLPPLDYPYDALEPFIDAETMHLHHDKHHQAYVNKLNEAIAPYPEFSSKSIETILSDFKNVPEPIQTAIKNQGGGHANHSLFWKILAKNGASRPQGDLAKAINQELEGFAKFQEDFNKAALGVFGSGWVWLVLDSNKKLKLVTTPNQNSPLLDAQTPLFGIDVWEHAYYKKYSNRRIEYIQAFANVLNWNYIGVQYQTLM